MGLFRVSPEQSRERLARRYPAAARLLGRHLGEAADNRPVGERELARLIERVAHATGERLRGVRVRRGWALVDGWDIYIYTLRGLVEANCGPRGGGDRCIVRALTPDTLGVIAVYPPARGVEVVILRGKGEGDGLEDHDLPVERRPAGGGSAEEEPRR